MCSLIVNSSKNQQPTYSYWKEGWTQTSRYMLPHTQGLDPIYGPVPQPSTWGHSGTELSGWEPKPSDSNPSARTNVKAELAAPSDRWDEGDQDREAGKRVQSPDDSDLFVWFCLSLFLCFLIKCTFWTLFLHFLYVIFNFHSNVWVWAWQSSYTNESNLIKWQFLRFKRRK